MGLLKEIVYPKINEGAFSHVMDYKSQLQELIQRDGSGNIEYQILQERPSPQSRICVTCYVK